MPEPCINPDCANTSEDSWTCVPGVQYPLFNTTDEVRRLPRNIGACSRQPPTLFLNGLDNPELERLKIQFPRAANGNMFIGVTSATATACRLQNLTELVLSTKGS